MSKFCLIVVIVVTSFTACINKDDCGGPYPPNTYYVVDSIGTDFFSIFKPGITATEALRYDECVLDVIPYFHREIALKQQEYHWSIVSRAYACTPPIPPPPSSGFLEVYSESTVYLEGETLLPSANLSAYFINDNAPFNLDTIQVLDNLNFIKLRNAPDSSIDANFYLRYEEVSGKVFQSSPIRFLVIGK